MGKPPLLEVCHLLSHCLQTEIFTPSRTRPYELVGDLVGSLEVPEFLPPGTKTSQLMRRRPDEER
jgi:hypothetical protein